MTIFGRMKANKDTLKIIRERFSVGKIRAREVSKLMDKFGLDINDAWKMYTTKGKDIDD